MLSKSAVFIHCYTKNQMYVKLFVDLCALILLSGKSSTMETTKDSRKRGACGKICATCGLCEKIKAIKETGK